MVRLRQMWPFVCSCLVVAILAVSSTARAQATNPRAYPINVVAIDSDDAEDQADALTTALRSRVRATPGFNLVDTSTSLSTLTAALKCPKVPDAPCLSRIAEQLKTDRFIWGTMTKAPGNQVAVDVHLYARGKPDISAKETYSDNLKDQNDETLRRLAQRLFERLAGGISSGILVVHAGTAGGTLSVAGQTRALDNGDASMELPPGVHSYEVIVPGFRIIRDSVTITSGKDTKIHLTLIRDEGHAEAEGKPVPVRKIIGYSALGVGAGLLVVAGIEALHYVDLKSKQDDLISHNIPQGKDACKDFPPGSPHESDAVTACGQYRSGIRVSTAAWILAGAGVAAVGTGIVLLATGASNDGPPNADRGRGRIRVVPALGPTTGGLSVLGNF